MNEEIRRAVAFAVLAPPDGNQDCEIYSYDKDRRSKFSGNNRDFHDYDSGARIVRFCFPKKDETLNEAVRRLGKLRE